MTVGLTESAEEFMQLSETGITEVKEYPELVEYYNELTRYER